MSDFVFDRREFLKGALAGAFLLLTTDTLQAAEGGKAEEKPIPGPPVSIGLIGVGAWGRQLATTLAKMPSAKLVAICDVYQPYLDRAKKTAPDAAAHTDYRRLLESKDVEAVIIATPSYLHKQIALDSIAAGKHVYCEAPLAVTVEDAREIALAGKGSSKVFQVGLQGRSNLLYRHVEKFVRSGCLGKTAQAYGQSNKKHEGRKMAPDAEREKELNWRLYKATSTGLIGEQGIHQIDLVNWYLGALPVSAVGFGAIIHWKDGRDVPDTVQCVIEYPGNVRMVYMATQVNSFSADYTLFQGSDSSLALRENRGWMIKEADSPLLGWEVYARKEVCFEETGICMIVDATKILAEGREPGKEGSVAPEKEPVYCALENFVRSIRENSKPVCGAVEGYQAAVVSIKANEAVMTGSKVMYQREWFEL
ncbi:MAG: Gfo/Idh/MocA family oxidoreductase [Armatimonadetes bacterium]|nr:Gfo/Idh/MocA family oxidoreductase [Armatimonadota bacterium]